LASLAAFPKCYIEEISERRMSLETWVEMASHLSVDGLELYGRFLTSLRADYLRATRRLIRSKGLQMPMMCYSPDFTVTDKSARDREVVEQQEMIKATAELGGSFCRVLSGQARPEVPVDEGVKWVVDCIGRCLVTAEQCGVTMVIENHYKDPFWVYPEFAQKRDVFLEIVDAVDSPYFGVQYDPSNAIVAGEDPLDLLRVVKHRVRTVHASDRYLEPGSTLHELKQADGTVGYSPKLRHGVIGKGLNDYDEIMRTLKAVGFDGWISIEDGMNGIEEIEESAVFLSAKMAEYSLA
jgi:sugar phosphate isomerase/epimerase